ncbi:MAG TPA: ferrochelatase [Cyclobacteriaceae bacterium]|nr:ferrochelatase [Cyclobacteriaceae bacterium]
MNDGGLLLLNLGSPDSFSVPDVRRYLGEFLMDERVIDAPYLVRSMIVKGFILPFRPQRSAHAYSKIWTKEGSPLKVITESFKIEIEKTIDMPVAVAMRYGNPTPAAAFEELRSKCKDLKRVFVAPMYPHYAMSSYETAIEHMLKEIPKEVAVRVLKPFYSEKHYIDCLAESIRPHLQESFDHVLFSYHGLPVRHLKKSDRTGSHCYSTQDCCHVPSKAWDTCYRHQVTRTTNLVAEKLGLLSSQYTISFQSRLGRDEWIRPFTMQLLDAFPSMGIKKLVIVCPAFVADCLETLEEIGMTAKESFLKAGGESLNAVPCLNTFGPWVTTFAAWCNQRDRQHASLWT